MPHNTLLLTTSLQSFYNLFLFQASKIPKMVNLMYKTAKGFEYLSIRLGVGKFEGENVTPHAWKQHSNIGIQWAITGNAKNAFTTIIMLSAPSVKKRG
jgi:hypothetical protein